MRWPRWVPHWVPGRLRPSMVEISDERLVALLQASLYVDQLEAEGSALRAEAVALENEARARELIDEHAPAAGVESGMPELLGLLEELPQHPDGTLHEPAFVALLDVRLWDARLQAATQDVAATTPQTSPEEQA